jgi:hypothetical protein
MCYRPPPHIIFVFFVFHKRLIFTKLYTFHKFLEVLFNVLKG